MMETLRKREFGSKHMGVNNEDGGVAALVGHRSVTIHETLQGKRVSKTHFYGGSGRGEENRYIDRRGV